MLPSFLIFLVVYAVIASEKIDKTIAVMIGASVMIGSGLVPFKTAIAAIDFNVIFLLVGMMTCVHILSRTGFFEYLATSIAQMAKGIPILILLFFVTLTAVLSAFLDNVTTIILLAPVTILITQLLEISPVPFLILEAIASNIGGTATLIGDPPNVIIGSRGDLTFNDFLTNLGVAILVIYGVFLGTVYFFFRKRWNVPEKIKRRIIEADPRLAIIDKPNMVKALSILALVFLGFLTQEVTHLLPGLVAITGSMLMMIFCKSNIDRTFMRVEWGVIFFFIGFFMIVSGLEHNGLIDLLALKMIAVGGHRLFLLCALILVGSALLSSVTDNIPYVITMVPIIQKLIPQLASFFGIVEADAIQLQIAHPLWWSLALGACLGGNGTLVGASANVVVSKIAEKNRYPITFARFFRYGFPFMVQSLLISLLYIWLRYFVFQTPAS